MTTSISEKKGYLSFLSNVKYEHLLAGLSGGLVSTLILHPLDVIKIRLAVNDGRIQTTPKYTGKFHFNKIFCFKFTYIFCLRLGCYSPFYLFHNNDVIKDKYKVCLCCFRNIIIKTSILMFFVYFLMLLLV